MFISISKKLAVWLILVSFVPIFAIFAFIYYDAYDRAIDREFAVLECIANSRSEFVTYGLGEERKSQLLNSNRPLFRKYLKNYQDSKKSEYLSMVQNVLKDVKKLDEDIDCISVVGIDGKTIASSDETKIGVDFSTQKIFKAASGAKIYEEYIGNAEGGYDLRMSSQIIQDDEVIGILITKYKMAAIKKTLANYQGLGRTGETLVHRRDGNGSYYCVFPHRHEAHNKADKALDSRAHSAFVKQIEAQKDKKRMILRDYDGQDVLAVAQEIDNSDLSTVITIRKNEVIQWLDILSSKVMAIFILSIIIALALIKYFTRSISTPLSKLTNFAVSVSKGNLHIKNDVVTNDEIGILANTLNDTVARLADATELLELKIQERTAELENANEELQSSENLIKAILNIQDNLVVVTDGKKIFHANTAFLNFFGCELESLTGNGQCFCVWLIFDPMFRHKCDICDGWLDMIELQGWRVDARNVLDGSLRNFIVVSKPFADKEGQFVVTFTDITKIQEEKEYFVHLAITDTLTGLHNRIKLNEVLGFLTEKAKRYDLPFCLIMIDLDYFKTVNDTFGHQKGDEVLKHIGAVIRENIRSSDFAARYGGEEFVILTPNITLENARLMAEKLRKAVELAEMGDLRITASLGIGQYESGETANSFLSRVDDLLYRAKGSGRNCVIG